MTEPTSSRDSGAPEEKLVGADRVIAVLTELADHPLGVTLDELAGTLRSSKPTVHRALATLRRAGLADMTGRGVYVLGDEYLRLAFRNLDGRPETARIQPLLEQLAARVRRDRALRRPLRQRHRLPGEGGSPTGRRPPDVGDRRPQSGVSHGCRQGPAERPTARPRSRSSDWFGPFPLEQKTPHTLTTPEALLEELEATRRRGFAIDDQENEIGINCVAMPVYLDGSTTPAGAVSVSAVTFRCPLERLIDAVPRFARRSWSAWGRAPSDSRRTRANAPIRLRGLGTA